MCPWRTFKRLLVHCHPRPKVGLRRCKAQLHARSREGPDDCRRQQVNCVSFLPSSKAFVSPLTSCEPYSAIFIQRAGSDTQIGLRRAQSLAWILPRRYFLPSSYFWSGGSFEAFKNALSNFAFWADIFVLALKGARAIQNFTLKS